MNRLAQLLSHLERHELSYVPDRYGGLTWIPTETGIGKLLRHFFPSLISIPELNRRIREKCRSHGWRYQKLAAIFRRLSSFLSTIQDDPYSRDTSARNILLAWTRDTDQARPISRVFYSLPTLDIQAMRERGLSLPGEESTQDSQGNPPPEIQALVQRLASNCKPIGLENCS